MRLNKLFLLGTLLLVLSISFVGCRKKADTIVKIYVKDSANKAVNAATVTLTAVTSEAVIKPIDDSIYPLITTTNSAGEAVFNLNEVYELGQAGVAVLDVNVSSGQGTGKGIIKVVEETTSEETVFI